MKYVYKQLFLQMVKDKIFLFLLLLLTVLTSLSFFFIMFSIDGNMAMLNALDTLTENQQLYRNALNSNTTLAYTFLVSLIGLSAVVFVMFFYRFYRANKQQIGCIKALGYKDSALQRFFVIFTVILSVVGALIGLVGGYFLADIQISANIQTYAVTGLTKAIGIPSLIVGLIVPTAAFCIAAFLCYGFVKNKEAGALLAGNNVQSRFSGTLKLADKISRIAPKDKRFSLRIALRKPVAVLLLIVAVMSFNVCLILGQSLNISSAKVFEAQTKGHNYEYEIQYVDNQTAVVPEGAMTYMDSPATFLIGNYELERTITGLYDINELYELKNENNELLVTPEAGKVYINLEFAEIYGVEIGDILTVEIAGEKHTFLVEEIAVNAKSENIYMNGQELTEILGIAAGAYNGVLSMDEIAGDTVTNSDQRIEQLNRNAVSNKISAIINQATGVLVGAILIFLALYINFQDNTRDILILNMMGHRTKDIRKMLVDVYLPILWAAFVATIAPSILLARPIQNSLSITTDDYMPFGVNVFVVIVAFALVSFIYWVVQATFHLGVKRTIAKNEQSVSALLS